MRVELYVREQFGGDPWRAVEWLRNTLAMRVREVDALEERCERLTEERDRLRALLDRPEAMFGPTAPPLGTGHPDDAREMEAWIQWASEVEAALEGREP